MATKKKTEPVAETGVLGDVLDVILPDHDQVYKSDKAKPKPKNTDVSADAVAMIGTVKPVVVAKGVYRKGNKQLWFSLITNPEQINRWQMVPVRWVVKSNDNVVYTGLSLEDAKKAYDALV